MVLWAFSNLVVQCRTKALDDRLFEPYGVRAEGWIRLTACQPNRVQAIRYTIRVGIVRHEWSVAIHPAGFEPIERLVTGKRRLAELRAYSLIDTWLRQQRAQEL
jgi:hypothetical protein